MTALETSSYRIEDARSALWFGRWPGGWGDVVHGVAPGAGSTAAAMNPQRRIPNHPAIPRSLGSRVIAASPIALQKTYPKTHEGSATSHCQD